MHCSEFLNVQKPDFYGIPQYYKKLSENSKANFMKTIEIKSVFVSLIVLLHLPVCLHLP